MSIADLAWLPPRPTGFSGIRKGIPGSTQPVADLMQLASSRLNAIESGQLSKSLTKLMAAGIDLSPLAEFRLGIVSNSTTELLTEILPAAAIRHGVALQVTPGPYGQIQQQLLDPHSALASAAPDAVLIAVDHHWLFPDAMSADAAAGARIDEAIDEIAGMIAVTRQTSGAALILQTVAVPAESLFGNYDRRVAGSRRSRIITWNQALTKLASGTGCYLFDLAALAERVGTDAWFNPVQWHAYKLAHDRQYDTLHAEMLARIIGAIRGKTKKCLVLDLDNTVWGGAIGDEGIEGIKLGQGSAIGEAFLEVQRTALLLKARGIVLAVCSKNNEETARAPFRSHPEMLLKEDDIAVFQANWTDKASNLAAIAESLNIGLDALVLLDDNPAERAQVRAAAPLVGVPELPEDPSWYPRRLLDSGYFEAVSYSAEDSLRASSYAANARRVQVKASAGNLGDYLNGLEMKLAATPFDSQGLQRITQLINKTNQFNLTTRRLTEAEVIDVMADPRQYSLQIRLEDAFGDLGMIAVVIGSMKGDTLDIENWLMSCRVLGRKVEHAMLSIIARDAANLGVTTINARYLPTRKNNMVAEHYPQLGFSRVSIDDSGAADFTIQTDSIDVGELPMSIAHDPAISTRSADAVANAA